MKEKEGGVVVAGFEGVSCVVEEIIMKYQKPWDELCNSEGL